MQNLKHLTLILSALLIFPLLSAAQNTGDFRSAATGDWNVNGTWETWNGATWVAAASTPTSSTSVYIESSHNVTLTANHACDDLHLNNTSSARLTTGSNTLEINGKIRAYSGTAPGTDGNPSSSGSWINTSGGGLLKFVGNTRNLTESGQWNSNPSGWDVEFALTAGQTGTLNSHFMAENITISSGTVLVIGSLWFLPSDGSAGTGNMTISSGATLDMTNGNIQRTFATTSNSTSHFNTFTLDGTLNTFATDFKIDAATINLNGTVVFDRNGNQNFIADGPSTGGAAPNTYNNVTISLIGTRTLAMNTTINGTLELSNSTSTLANGGFAISYGASSTLKYGDIGAFTTTDTEFPSSSGPANLTIDNGTNEITLHAARTITGTLTMTNGTILTTTSNLLTIGSAGGTSGGSTTSYVNGPLAQTIASTSSTGKNFLVGKGSSYRRADLTITQSAATSTVYTVEMFNTAPSSRTLPANLNRVSGVRYWNITKGAGASVSTAFVTLNYGTNDGVDAASVLRIVKDDGGGNWTDLGGAGTGSPAGSITSGVSFTTFSDFTFANDNTSPGSNLFPVTLTSFSAKLAKDHISLDWSTASEINNEKFVIERSTDAKEWKAIATVKGAGNAQKVNNYLFKDITGIALQSPTLYYRLKQVDFDGQYEYSSVASVNLGLKGDVHIYPNPTIAEPFTVDFETHRNADVAINLIDLTGKVVSNTSANLERGRHILSIGADNLKPGIYFIRLQSEDSVVMRKVLVNQ